MAFVLHPPSKRRVKVGLETGMEYEERTNPLDESYLELLAEDGDKQRGEEEVPSTPMDALEKFTMAMGEMDVIMDLASNLQTSQVMDFKIMTSKTRSTASALQDACTDRLVRFGRRRQDLRDVSARLKQGAKDLQATADQDNEFYQQAAQLQRYWRLRANPATSEHANSPFSVELNLTDQPPPLLAQHSPASTAGKAAAVAVGASGGWGSQQGGGSEGALLQSRLALLQGPCGRLRVQVGDQGKRAAPSTIKAEPALPHLKSSNQPQTSGHTNNVQQEQQQQQEQQSHQPQPPIHGQATQHGDGEQQQQQQQEGEVQDQPQHHPDQPPQVHVAVGTRAVHRTLLSMQSRMLWHMVEGLLDADARSLARGSNNFGYSLAHKVVAAMAVPQAEPWLAALRPLVLEHAITRLLPSASIAPPPRPTALRPRHVHLLPSLAAWLHHAFYRNQLRARFDEQVHGMTDVSIHWENCSLPFTSVLQIKSAYRPPLLIFARESKVEVEGVFSRDGSKWTHMGRQTFNRQELPQLLQTILRPPS